MIRLYCEDGEYADAQKNFHQCRYERIMPDEALAELITHSKAMGGFHCPVCHKFKLRTSKRPGVLPYPAFPSVADL